MEKKFKELYKLIAKLRNECPWDKEQTAKSFYKSIKEEVEELIEAIEKEDKNNYKEELGDVLWTTLFLSLIANEEGYCTIEDAMDYVKKKMIRRHPHVFGNSKAETPEEVIKQWIKIKEEEKN